MVKRVHLKGGFVNIRDVAQIEVRTVDLVKTDCKNLTLIVVEEKL